MGRYYSYTLSVMVPPTTREHHHPQWHLVIPINSLSCGNVHSLLHMISMLLIYYCMMTHPFLPPPPTRSWYNNIFSFVLPFCFAFSVPTTHLTRACLCLCLCVCMNQRSSLEWNIPKERRRVNTFSNPWQKLQSSSLYRLLLLHACSRCLRTRE